MKRRLFEGLSDDQASDKIAARRKMAGIDDRNQRDRYGNRIIATVGRSVGAKAKNYQIRDPITGDYVGLAEGTTITQPKNHIIAGKGRNRQIDDIDWLMDKYPGDSEEHWTKEKGFGYVYDEYGDKRRVELHWYQSPSNGRVEMKIKVQPGGEIYLDD